MGSLTPQGLDIHPRRLEAAIPDPMPRHWHGGDPFKSHLFNAMSVLFPVGERFFIHSVRLFRERITDPVLQEQIRGFIGQEGHHSREHELYNQRLRELGYDVDYLESGVKRRIGFIKKRFSAEAQLAGTCAVEHFTAILGNVLLANPRLLEGADPQMARLWRWHALEETEHKAVAFDMFMQVCGNRKMLRKAMRRSTFFFTLDTLKGMVHMLKRDGLLWNWRIWRDGISWLWGKNGVFRPLIGVYMDFYRDGFHPWQHDNMYLVEKYRPDYAGETLVAG
jgi:predicted metal-dependent hydrolase